MAAPCDPEDPTCNPANTCDVNAISSPDNLSYMPEFDTLVVGEVRGRGEFPRVQPSPSNMRQTGCAHKLQWCPCGCVGLSASRDPTPAGHV